MEIYNTLPPKEKKPNGRPSKYKPEFMEMVARKIVDEGVTYREVSAMFDLSHGSICAWVKKYKENNGKIKHRKPEQTQKFRIYKLEENICELKKEIGELYLENLMLKKALYHSRQRKKQNSSVITSENLDRYQEDVE